MQTQFQSGTYYTPGNRVLSYFIINRITYPIVFTVIVSVLLVLVRNAIVGANGLATVFPFDPAVLVSTGVPLVIGIGVIVTIIAAIAGWVQFKSVQFMFDDFAFHVVRGFFSKSEIAIPYRQIQNVNHEQTMNEKMWGIARVIIETAGTDEAKSSESDGVLPILDAKLATGLEAELLKRGSGK